MPKEYVLASDDTCDMPPEFYVKHGVPLLYLSCMIDGKSYKGAELPLSVFYEKLRQGKTPTTAQVNVEEAERFLEEFMRQGKDVLYLAFSSGLSGTYESVEVAARTVREKYPDRKILVVDSLCASMGEGLLLYKMIEKRDAGMDIEELAKFAETQKHNVAHYVAAEDLMHLHRGGRISKASAVMGSMLGIKPLINMNEEGRLVNIGKARGRKQSLNALVDLMAKAVGSVENDILFISHSDALEDAEYVAELVKKRMGVEKCMIHYIGTVIGSHTGPGTIAMFSMAERR